MRVLVFGDSITQGYWAVERGWVDRIRKFYDARQFEDLRGRNEPTIFNLGVSADNTLDILKRIKNEVSARTRPAHREKPAVIVQIGVNDSSCEPNEPQVPVFDYRKNLEQIINEIDSSTSQIIFVGSSACDESQTTPVAWGDHYYRNKQIKAYEDAMRQVAEDNNIAFIPVFNDFKKALDSGKELLADGLHPNEGGHEVIYRIVESKLRELLS